MTRPYHRVPTPVRSELPALVHSLVGAGLPATQLVQAIASHYHTSESTIWKIVNPRRSKHEIPSPRTEPGEEQRSPVT